MKHLLVLSIIFFLISSEAAAQQSWQAPAEADTLENPYSHDNEKVIDQGRELYETLCSSCHGPEGNGQGGAGQSFNPPPADFTSRQVQKQSDGSVFWKIRQGNPPGMLSYKNLLKEEEVWQLVTYLRQFAQE